MASKVPFLFIFYNPVPPLLIFFFLFGTLGFQGGLIHGARHAAAAAGRDLGLEDRTFPLPRNAHRQGEPRNAACALWSVE